MTQGTTTARPLAWRMLALGVAAQVAGTVFVSTPALLIPQLHATAGLGLAEAGALAAAPTVGMVLTLVAWGALADRVGERWVITIGLVATAAAATGAALLPPGLPFAVLLVLGGAAAASANAASGLVVTGWFPRESRGLAMGVRQIAQPVGVTLAAMTVPSVAAGLGIGAAFGLAALAAASAGLGCAIGLVDGPQRTRGAVREAAAPNPYRTDGFLWRVHGVSALLVVPQFTLSTFGLVWLVSGLGWTVVAAGVLISVAQFVGALGRILIGALSDRVGSRLTPLRWVAVAATVCMVLLAAVDRVGGSVLVALAVVVATAVTVADNGLAFAVVAEAAGSRWAGRALGVQNTAQFVAASAVGPVVGALAGGLGYAGAFLLVAACPAAAAVLVPRASAEPDRP